jgi:AmmeMemoRadiSam system protein B/AmmeMemoRadiSam system protein A
LGLTRQPAVAGAFYPGVRDQLAAVVNGLLDAASKEAQETARAVPKAIIAPHAGYVYSGAVAATAYASLAEARSIIKRVVLLGPSHRVALRGLATTSAESFLTPLGAIPIDREVLDIALRFPQVEVVDAAHAHEHSLEVHLPFLQIALDRFSLAPFSVGEATPEEVAVVLEAIWGGPETLIVVSSDLSHFHDYETARRLDAASTRAIEKLEPEGLDSESACGCVPVRGLLVSAKRHGLGVETVDLRNSGDTAGPKDRVVGYGSYLFRASSSTRDGVDPGGAAETSETADLQLEADENEDEEWEQRFDELLLDVARRSIETGSSTGQPLPIDIAGQPAPLREIRSSFVTLKLEGQLRGCIGSLEAQLPLAADVSRSAYRAAYRDPRFRPVTSEERDRLELHISVLSPMARISFSSETDLLSQLRPGVDGLLLRDGRANGTFLPSVWESLPESLEFLRSLKQKAGLPRDHWSSSVEVFRYTTRSIG